MSNEIVKGMTIVDFLSIYKNEFERKFNERKKKMKEDYKKENGYYYDIGQLRENLFIFLKILDELSFKDSDQLLSMIIHNVNISNRRDTAYKDIKDIKDNVFFRKRKKIILKNTPRITDKKIIIDKSSMNKIEVLQKEHNNLLKLLKDKWYIGREHNVFDYTIEKRNIWFDEIFSNLSSDTKEMISMLTEKYHIVKNIIDLFKHVNIHPIDMDVYGDDYYQFTNFKLFWKQLQGECVDMSKSNVLSLFKTKYNIDEIINEGF